MRPTLAGDRLRIWIGKVQPPVCKRMNRNNPLWVAHNVQGMAELIAKRRKARAAPKRFRTVVKGSFCGFETALSVKVNIPLG